MAIAFLRAATAFLSTASATSGSVTFTINAGETAAIVFSVGGGGGAATGWGISTITNGGTWTRQARSANVIGSLTEICEIWTTGAAASTAATSLSVTWTRGDSFSPVIIVGGAYSGVAAIGTSGVLNQSTATTTPGISLTTQDANNFVIAGYCCSDAGSVSAATANTGTIRSQRSDNGSALGVLGVLTDNTAATASAVVNRVTSASRPYNLTAVELRSTGGGGGGRTLFVQSGLDGHSTSGSKQFNPSLGYHRTPDIALRRAA